MSVMYSMFTSTAALFSWDWATPTLAPRTCSSHMRMLWAMASDMRLTSTRSTFWNINRFSPAPKLGRIFRSPRSVCTMRRMSWRTQSLSSTILIRPVASSGSTGKAQPLSFAMLSASFSVDFYNGTL